MKTKRVIILIEFNSRSEQHEDYKIGLTAAWIQYRMSIFIRYTLQSLKKQTDQNFIAIIQYAKSTEATIYQALAQYAPLPENIRFAPLEDYLLQVTKEIQGYGVLYLVRLDCDDTYHKSFVQQLNHYQHRPDTQALINQYGYVFDSLNDRLATFKHVSPPYYTLIYNTQDFLDGKRYRFNGHAQVIALKHEMLAKRNFLIIIHSRNKMNQGLLSRTQNPSWSRGPFETDRKKVANILNEYI